MPSLLPATRLPRIIRTSCTRSQRTDAEAAKRHFEVSRASLITQQRLAWLYLSRRSLGTIETIFRWDETRAGVTAVRRNLARPARPHQAGVAAPLGEGAATRAAREAVSCRQGTERPTRAGGPRSRGHARSARTTCSTSWVASM